MIATLEAVDLAKAFGKTLALDRLNLTMKPGQVMALLGPNGAGKTTAVRILTTLLKPDSGRAEVAGYDVVRDAAALRSVDWSRLPVSTRRWSPR